MTIPSTEKTTDHMIPTRTAALTDISDFLDAIFPPEASGKARAAFGIGPRWKEGRYDHDDWRERAFDYPANRDTLIEFIDGAVRNTADAYLCTGLSYNGSREEASLKEVWTLHSDWDGNPDDTEQCIDAVKALGGFAFESGTAGHLHCFLPLAEPITASPRYDSLCAAFHAKLPAGSEKFKWNDVLRIVGTDSLKDTVRPGGSGQPTRLQWALQPIGYRWEIHELAARLGVHNTAQKPPQATNSTTPTIGTTQGAPFALEDYPDVAAALNNPKLKSDGTVDRSETIWATVLACAASNLTQAHAQWAVTQRQDLADKLAAGSRDDVLHCWLKAIDSRQEARRNRAGENFFDPNTDDGGNPAPTPEDPTEASINNTLTKLRIDREARRRLDEETRPAITLPPIKPLDVLLAEPDSTPPFLIDRVAPAGGRILLSAQYKAGKTHLIGNLARSLADGGQFLDRFTVNTQKTGIVLIDDELSENLLRRWLSEQSIRNTGAVADVISLRGKVNTLNLIDDKCRAMWATRLRDIGCDYLALDCLRPVLDSLGLDENRDAGRFLVAFDALLDEAGIPDAALVQHMGHSNERARGDSRLQDWPDAIWRLIREDDTPDSARYFTAYGRDVDVPEGQLTLDKSTRRLTYATGSRKTSKAEVALKVVIDVLAADAKADREGLSTRQIDEALNGSGHPRTAVRDARKLAVARGFVKVVPGANASMLHSIVNPCSECGRPMLIGQTEKHRACASWDEDQE